MKIDAGITSTSAGAAQVGESAAASGSSSKRGTPGAAGGGDTVELSGPLRLLQTFATSRAARIQELTQSVRNGTYSVNAQDVSRSLVKETLAGAAAR